MTHSFSRNDVVEYKTGKTYIVGFQHDADRGSETIGVSGWKNGKVFGAYRRIAAADCKLVGRRVATADGAAWEYEPAEAEAPAAGEPAAEDPAAEDPAAVLAVLEAESAEIAKLSAEREAEREAAGITHLAGNVGNAGNQPYAGVCGARGSMTTMRRQATCPACLAEQ